MKKLRILFVLIAFSSVALFSATPDYFAFELASGAAYDVDSGDILVTNGFGFNYAFDETFAGGFGFRDIDGSSVDTLNIVLTPAENLSLSMYTGQVVDTAAAAHLAFGAGIGYDIFVKADRFFTSLGLYFDWFASDAASGTAGGYSIEDGGVFSMGLKTKIGM